jgi:hypothetical protein
MSEKKNDGGSVYPIPGQGNGWFPGNLTIRDYFAAAALQGLCSNPDWAIDNTMNVVTMAFAFADTAIMVRGEERER